MAWRAIAARVAVGWLGGTGIDCTAFADATRATGAPLAVVNITDPVVRALCERDLILVRPDLHVAWRGDQVPVDTQRVAEQITGRLSHQARPATGVA